MHLCGGLPPYRIGPMLCNGTCVIAHVSLSISKCFILYFVSIILCTGHSASAIRFSANEPTDSSCVNWNQYYTNCTQLGGNPFQGTISFDNIGLAWVAIFLVNPNSSQLFQTVCVCSLAKFFHVAGHLVGRVDRHNVLCTRRPQFLGLDLLCSAHCGMLDKTALEKFLVPQQTLFKHLHSPDWILLHDQPLSRRYRHTILRDQEARNGTNATGAGTVHILIHVGLQHK